MINAQTEQIMADILEYKGDKFLVLCAIEEMAEFAKELLKNINRGKDNIDDVIEELANIYVCLGHIKNIYGVSDVRLAEIINEKMPRKWRHKIAKWKAEAKG